MPTFRPPTLRAALLGCLLLAAPGRPAQLPLVEERLDVEVVSLDVVVTDADGRPVRGLERGDFALRLDGREVPIDYFSAFETGPEAPADGAGRAKAPDLHRPLFVVVHDGFSLRPAEARQVLAELAGRLDDLLAATRSVMVVHQGRSLAIAQPFTRDRLLLRAALDALPQRPGAVADLGARDLLLGRLESATPPEMVFEGAESLQEEQAIGFLHEIRGEAELERQHTVTALAQLRRLTASLAALPGPKTILYLGAGLSRLPGEALYRLWWRKYQSLASAIGVASIQSEMVPQALDRDVDALLAEATAHRIAFYAADPGAPRVAGGAVRFASRTAGEPTGGQALASRDVLRALADGTGGLVRSFDARVDSLIDQMLSGLGSFYSLGFTVTPDLSTGGRIEVRTSGAGHRLRHPSRPAAGEAPSDLESLTLGALLTDLTDNPLQVELELGEPERQGDGSFLVDLLVKIPVARLTLLPEGASHVGRISIAFIARSPRGELSEPGGAEVPVEIENRDLLRATSGSAGFRTPVRVSSGRQTIAIAVRDDVSRTDSTLSVVVTAGEGS